MQQATCRPQDDETREFLASHSDMVLRTARRIQEGLPNRNAFDDMVQAGFIALWRLASHHLRFSAPEEFARLAAVRVRGAMLDCLREEDWAPRRLRAKAKEIERAITELSLGSEAQPTSAMIAQHLGLTLEEYQRTLEDVGLFHLVYWEDLNGMESDIREPASQFSILSQVEAAEWKARIATALKALPDRCRVAVSLYFYEELSMDEIARVMGFTSKGYASRLVNEGILRMRQFWRLETGD